MDGEKLRKQLAWAVLCGSTLLFLLAGLALIPYPGLQADEIFFWQSIHSPGSAFYRVSLGGTTVPFMIASYAGALKTWLYAGLFSVFRPTVWSVRIPVLLAGVLTLWLTWFWVRRIAGTAAASVTTLLLATDSIFLLTDIFDWGPVALQHVFLMGGLLAVQSWLQRSSKFHLALGFFLWGLGLWDKALLIWPLIGLAVGVLVAFPREFFDRLRPVPAMIALLSLMAGVTPLLWYNVGRHGATATENVNFRAEKLREKVGILERTINGTALVSYMVHMDSENAQPRAPRNLIERAAAHIKRRLDGQWKNRMLAGCFLALICFGLLWGTAEWRILLLLLIAMSVEWALMALTHNAGTSAHHVILIWPFPLIFIGIALSATARRLPRFGWPALAVIVAVLVSSNLIITNRYLADFAANGAAGVWSDAIYPLAAFFRSDPKRPFAALDWGYLNQIPMLADSQTERECQYYGPSDKTGLQGICFPLGGDAGDLANIVFIQHADGNEIIPGVNAWFRVNLAGRGYREEPLRVVRDDNGRPIFELFQVRRD